MKRFLILIFVVCGCSCTCHAQTSSYGISAGIGNGFIQKQVLVGGPSYDLNTGLCFGLQYNKKLVGKLFLSTGIQWYQNTISVTPSFYPGIDRIPKKYDVQLLYVPIFLKVNLAKYFFITGGLIGDIDVSKDSYITSQSGAGAGSGIGTEFILTKKLSMQLNPYINFHGLLMAARDQYPERIFDSGIRVSLMLNQ